MTEASHVPQAQYNLAAWAEIAHPNFGDTQTNHSLEPSIINNINSLTTFPDKMRTIRKAQKNH